jgi:hypothetical protein
MLRECNHRGGRNNRARNRQYSCGKKCATPHAVSWRGLDQLSLPLRRVDDTTRHATSEEVKPLINAGTGGLTQLQSRRSTRLRDRNGDHEPEHTQRKQESGEYKIVLFSIHRCSIRSLAALRSVPARLTGVKPKRDYTISAIVTTSYQLDSTLIAASRTGVRSPLSNNIAFRSAM